MKVFHIVVIKDGTLYWERFTSCGKEQPTKLPLLPDSHPQINDVIQVGCQPSPEDFLTYTDITSKIVEQSVEVYSLKDVFPYPAERGESLNARVKQEKSIVFYWILVLFTSTV